MLADVIASMSASTSSVRLAARPRIVIAGGGFAAVESLLALRSLVRDRVDIQLVAPDRRLVYRPAATAQPFTGGEPASFDLEEIAADAGATLRLDRVAAVAPHVHRLRLACDATLEYSVLVLAVGARGRAAIPGALTFRDQRDAPLLRHALDHAWAQERHRVVFAGPAGVTWTLPLYELALQTAAEADERGIAAEIAIATPERRPLEVFGPGPSDHVAGLLADRDIRFLGRMQPSAVRRDGLALLYEGLLPAEAVIAVPRLAGQRISGVPADWNGFALTDDLGRVEGSPDVYAAGDMTRYPVKQGGLAVQQAEGVARTVAAGLGAELEPQPTQPILRARLIGAGAPLYLQVALDASGRPVVDGEVLPETEEPPWWPGAKVFGRHLAPYLAERLARAA